MKPLSTSNRPPKASSKTNTNYLFLFLFLITLLSDFLIAQAQTEQCAEGEVCENDAASADPLPPQNTKTQVRFINKSEYRADIYWDDGRFGSNIATIETRDGEAEINTFVGHSFFVNRYGLSEPLRNPETDERYEFHVKELDQLFVIPESAAPSVNPCQDRFSSCKAEAERGECTNNPGWMIVHCCRACDEKIDAARLIDPKVRCTRENLGMAGPAWKPGDLNKLFKSWAVDEKFAKYEPKVLSSPDGEHGGQSGPWVMVFDNFLTDNEVDTLIEGGHMMDFKRSADSGAANELGETVKIISQVRTSSNAWCTGRCASLPGIIKITDKIEMVTGVPKVNYESFQILNYQKGQYYQRHHDSSSNNDRTQGPRIMTFFLYLNDVEEGGETEFTDIHLTVEPKKGRALVWPSVTDADPEKWDPRMYHQAKDVVKGEKFAANHWIHLYDFETPNHWGCSGSFS